jgi:hypothetical protein
MATKMIKKPLTKSIKDTTVDFTSDEEEQVKKPKSILKRKANSDVGKTIKTIKSESGKVTAKINTGKSVSEKTEKAKTSEKKVCLNLICVEMF